VTDEAAEPAGDDEPGTPRPRRNTRPRDHLGRPLPYGSDGVAGPPEGVLRSPAEALTEADRLLSQDRPFHAHEVLEDAWKSGPSAEAALWRGLAQLAVGVTHAARGNAVGGTRLIERGAQNIAPYESSQPHGLDVSAILAGAAYAVAEIARHTPVRLRPPPLRPYGRSPDDAEPP
jgi:uncharacterized protein